MAQCYRPFFVDAPSGAYYDRHPVPCGKCPACLQRRASSWGFRLNAHLRVAPAHFVTLTYASPPLSPSGRMTLVKRDWQLFMKRLRKEQSHESTIRYYAVGEYGSRRFRPHFHAIMYGIDPETVLRAWSPDNGTLYSGVPGLIEVDPDVNLCNIAYVCKYITKGRVIPQYKGDDRIPEFALMSKNLGLCYLTPKVVRYHKADISRSYVTLPGGIKTAMPRYYKDRIFSPEQREEMFFTSQDTFRVRFAKDMAEWSSLHPNQVFETAFSEAIKQSEKLFFKSQAMARLDL